MKCVNGQLDMQAGRRPASAAHSTALEISSTGVLTLNRRQLATFAGLASCAMLTHSHALAETSGPEQTFLVYYGAKPEPAAADFGVLALDSEYDQAALSELRVKSIVLGYLSIAEVHTTRPYFSEMAAAGLLGAENPAWPDARFVDMRDVRWRRRVLDDIVPGILKRGFHGLIIDTLDSAETLER